MSAIQTLPGFTPGGVLVVKGWADVPAGRVLSMDEFAALNFQVRRLWLREGNLVPIYCPNDKAPRPAGERHIIHRGAGRYDVVQGVQINKDSLTREEAEALANVAPVAA